MGTARARCRRRCAPSARLRYNGRVEWPVAVAIVLLAAVAAFIQSLAGFGFSLFIVPFLALIIGPRDTVLLANLLSTVTSAMQVRLLRESIEVRTAGVLVVGSLIGMPAGLAVLLFFDAVVLQVFIAVMVILSTVLLIRGLRLHAAGAAGDFAAGITSGVLNTSTSMSGPPVVLYLQGRGMAPLEFRATIAAFFVTTSAVAIILLLASGAAENRVFLAWGLSLPAVFVGQRLGNICFERVDHVLFRRLVYVILLVTGVVAIVGAVSKAA